jgi:hypothetical protein
MFRVVRSAVITNEHHNICIIAAEECLELRGSRKILGSYRFFNEGKLKMLL